ncbi:MAG TPA: hypothetical protein VK760_04645 [Candidatus Acidoferrales bacterium]|nr:hypothetical protein [Candidatus Acidoferrales bacterium]
MCIPTAEMLSLEAAIGKSQLESLENAGASLDASVKGSEGFLFQNKALGIALTVPRYTPPTRTRYCQPEGMFDQVLSISAAYIVSFADTLRFRESFKWPIQGANLSAATSTTVLIAYGKYVLVLLSDDAIRKDASGNVLFDCGGSESYRVNPATGQVLAYNGCVEFGGVRALPRLSQLPD